MKHVIVDWSEDLHGFWTDPRDYVKEMPDFLEELPSGARKFAADQLVSGMD